MLKLSDSDVDELGIVVPHKTAIMAPMAAHRFYVPGLHAGIVDLAPNEAHHAHSVMRLNIGDAVELFDGKGTVATGTIHSVGKRECAVEVPDIQSTDRPSANPLTLAMAMPKAPRQSFLFEKCTELGVAAILPVTFGRSVVKMSSSGITKWQRTIIEAGKQCRTAYLPEILEPVKFKKAAESMGDNKMHLVCDPAGAATIADQIEELKPKQDCTVWIGPEGGMKSEEVDQLSAQGAICVSLGSNILRIETAALAVASAFTLRGH